MGIGLTSFKNGILSKLVNQLSRYIWDRLLILLMADVEKTLNYTTNVLLSARFEQINTR